ncbi:hypothetical protein [Flavobacterium sp. GT3P67]|uniref:hypothetical protein n=1 Tax=Flavobacterium sp. GT3P67 TaxID=2541722 RepID=UPI00104D2426|nr:hypothetical protein [Flavobacterium sp. GT3P67]TDE54843.1 hypothetical protein E0H99_00600 [Flavobacterium sp. GT3P67]
MKNYLIFFIVVFVFYGCDNQTESSSVNSNHNLEKEIVELKKKTTISILKMSKNKSFKEFVLKECLKQEHGDYNVYLSKIIEEYEDKSAYKDFVNELKNYVEKVKMVNGGLEPLIFYPRAETIEEKSNQKLSKVAEQLAQIISVDGDVYNPETYSAPGYVLDSNGDLAFFDNITEEYAWENDVWVIGLDEMGVNMSSAGDDLLTAQTFVSSPPSRFDGQPEYGGIIQVTDLNEIEPWIAGKLEFRIIIFDSKGVKVKDKEFDKRKRSHFRNNKWYDYGFFVADWNTSTFGNWMTEKWMEVDGGNSNAFIYTIPPAVPGGVSVSVTVPSKDRDDDLGLTIVQFTEPISQVYNLSHINIKRKHL